MGTPITVIYFNIKDAIRHCLEMQRQALVGSREYARNGIWLPKIGKLRDFYSREANMLNKV